VPTEVHVSVKVLSTKLDALYTTSI